MDPETNSETSDLDDSFTFTPALHYLARYFTRAAENAHFDKFEGKGKAIAQGVGEEYTTGLNDALIAAFETETCADRILPDVFMVLTRALMQMYDVNPGAMRAAAGLAQGEGK